MTASSRPRSKAPRFIPKLSTQVDTFPDQKTLDEAERQQHIRVLSLCAMAQGIRSAWFRRPDTISIRLGYLKGATREDLREECQSRYGRIQLWRSIGLALLLDRWRSIFWALPLVIA